MEEGGEDQKVRWKMEEDSKEEKKSVVEEAEEHENG